MKKYLFAKVNENAQVIDSDIDKEGVKVWMGARVQNSQLDKKVSVGNDSIVVKSKLSEKCEIGRRNIISNATLGRGTSTQGNTTLRFCCVGKYCAIAWNVTIGAPNHNIHRLAMAELNYVFENEEHEHLESFENLGCTIGNDVWIAAGAHVLRGVKIADGAVVAANAVVTKDVPPYAIVAGVPAKVIGYRFEKEQINRLLEIQWWNFSENQLERIRAIFEGDLTEEKIIELEHIKEDI